MDTTPTFAAPPADAIVEREICLQCLEHNVPGTTFCRRCGAPLSAHAAIGPFESARSEGFVCRRAAERADRPVILAGMWILFGSLAFILAPTAVEAWRTGNIGTAFIATGIAALSVALVIKTTHTFFRSARRRRAASAEPSPEA
jgi:hypothetical protein